MLGLPSCSLSGFLPHSLTGPPHLLLGSSTLLLYMGHAMSLCLHMPPIHLHSAWCTFTYILPGPDPPVSFLVLLGSPSVLVLSWTYHAATITAHGYRCCCAYTPELSTYSSLVEFLLTRLYVAARLIFTPGSVLSCLVHLIITVTPAFRLPARADHRCCDGSSGTLWPLPVAYARGL